MTLTRLEGPHIGLYSYIMSKLTCFIERDNSFFEVLQDGRAVIKQITMNLLYTEGSVSRAQTIKEELIKLNPHIYHTLDWSDEQKKEIFEIAIKFPKFIDNELPHSRKAGNLLLKLAELFSKVYEKVMITSPDDITFTYAHNEFESRKNARVVDPITKKILRLTYRPMVRKGSIDYKKLKSSFLPCLVHSIDAWLVREIVFYLGEKNEFGPVVQIQTIHDAFLMPPNDVLQFFKVTDFIYRSKMNNLLYDFYLRENIDMFPSDRYDTEVKPLLKKLNKFLGEDKPIITSSSFNVMDFYLLEGY